MSTVTEDLGTAAAVADALRRRRDLPTLDVFDERFYPPRDEEPEVVARYFLVMVAMDHRLGRPGRPYSACIDEGCYSGADLLYALGARKLREDPGFFSPSRLLNVTVDDVLKTFSAGAASPPDPEVRAYLLRDLGLKLQKLYGSRALALLALSGSRVRGDLTTPGLADNLRVFRAYEDPVEKKTMLLTKFLVRRGLFRPLDRLDLAVDNHLTRIAYRTGLVRLTGMLWEKVSEGREVTLEEDVILRMLVRRAYRTVSELSGIPPEELDDHLWVIGRERCLRDSPPRCHDCPLNGACLVGRGVMRPIAEHKFYRTWYY